MDEFAGMRENKGMSLGLAEIKKVSFVNFSSLDACAGLVIGRGCFDDLIAVCTPRSLKDRHLGQFSALDGKLDKLDEG